MVIVIIGNGKIIICDCGDMSRGNNSSSRSHMLSSNN